MESILSFISRNIWPIICVVLCCLLIIVWLSKSKSTEAKSTKAPTERSRRAEQSRRDRAANRIRTEIEQALKDSEHHLQSYISNLKRVITERDKKIFFNVAKRTETNPPHLFDKLQTLFKLHRDAEILYCRRYYYAFGSNEYFIITKDGFAFGTDTELRWLADFEEIADLSCSDLAVSFNYDLKVLLVDRKSVV